jgi:site-specific DNA recombinase
VRLGGTPSRAPLGYRNVIDRIDGKEIRSVALDPGRAPHVVWAFEAYATGEYLLRELTEAVNARGFRTRPTPKTPEGKPLSVSGMERILANPYYAGIVRFEGVEYQGRHEPLISLELFHQVQALKHSRRLSKEKPYQHPHYLKGSLYCGSCGERLGVTKTKNRHGMTYPYFYCLGRQKRRSPCRQPYVAMDVIEERVAELWKAVEVPAEQREALRREVLDLASRTRVEQTAEMERQTARLARLDAEREKLLQAHYAEAIPLDLLKREQERIGRQMAACQAALAQLNTELGDVERGLGEALLLVSDCHRLYQLAPAHVRRQLNQAVFERIVVEDDEVSGGHWPNRLMAF